MEAKLMRSLYFITKQAEYKGKKVDVEVQIDVNYETGECHVGPWRNGGHYFDFDNGTIENSYFREVVAECILEAIKFGRKVLRQRQMSDKNPSKSK